MTTSSPLHNLAWHKTVRDRNFCISTLKTNLNHEFINDAFATQDMYWATRLEPGQLQVMIDNSLNLGLYEVQPESSSSSLSARPDSSTTTNPSTSTAAVAVEKDRLEQIGYARFSTDFMTTAHLTDIYIAPEYRGWKLGSWMIECCDESLKHFDALRNITLVAADDVRDFYKRHLRMRDVKDEEGFTIMHRPRWSLEENH